MKNNLYIDGVHYLTAREAGDVLGYAPDYVSRLCREGKLRGRRSGKSWIVEADSLVPFIKAHEAKKLAWHQDLSRELKSVAEPIIVRDENFEPLSSVRVAPRQLHILRASQKAHAAREAAQTLMITRITVSSVFAVLLLFVASTTALSTPIANMLRGAAVDQVAAASFFSPLESIARTSYSSMTSIACAITGWCENVQPMPVVYVRAPQQAVAQDSAPTHITNNITNYIQPTVGSGGVLASGISEQLLDSRLNTMENYLTGRIDLLAYEGQRQTEDLAEDFANGMGGGGFDDIDITDSSFSGGSISGSTLSGVNFSGETSFPALVASDATTTNLYIEGSFGFGTSSGLLQTTNGTASTLANGGNGQVLKMVGGNLTWSTDLTGGGGGGASFFASTTDDLAIYPADPTDVVIIGDSATTSVGNILEIAGDSLFRGAMMSYNNVTAPRFTATSSVASVFPYASTTAISTNSLCISGDCRQAWPTDSAFSTTSADYLQTQRNYFSTTSADFWKTANSFFSTTSADAWKDQRNFFSTSSASYFLAQNQGAAFSTTSASYFLSTQGSLGFSTTSNDYWITQRNFFSTSSSDYYKSVNDFFSTTSADAWKLTRDFFSTSSASYFLSQNGALGFSTTSANYFASSSTTIPKTFTANTFTSLQAFSNASSTLFSSSYASSTSIFAGTLCLTGDVCRTTWPTAGSSFAYPFSLSGNATSTLTQFNGGLTAFASSTIGNGTAAGGLTVNGTATTSRLVVTSAATSTFAGGILMNGSIVPSIDDTYSLGSPSFQWRDVYIGPGSLYINGQKVLEDDGPNIVVTADPGQNIAVQSQGTGDIELSPLGTGVIQLKGDVQLTAGQSLTMSDNSPVSMLDGAALGNISISGNTIQATNTNGGISITPAGNGGTYITSGNLGIGTTSPGSKLSVAGNIFVTGNIISTSTTASQFPFASTTALSASALCLSNDCIASWPTFTDTSFSTTSADYWQTTRDFFSTTSANFWKSANDFFSTTSLAYHNSVTDLFSTTSANFFAHSSTTIPKTYTANTFTALQNFANASSTLFSASYASTTALFANTASTSNLTISALQNGLLKVSATGVVSLATAGTDFSTFAYPFPANATSTLLSFNGGLTAYASSTIGDGTQAGGLTINGGATTTGSVSVGTYGVASTSLTVQNAYSMSGLGIESDPIGGASVGVFGLSTQVGGKFYGNEWGIVATGPQNLISGNLGVGTDPGSNKLHVTGNGVFEGEVEATYFTATWDTASVFPYASTTALSATSLCLASDCRTSWPSGITYPFSLTGNATSTLTQFNGGLTAYASTTIGAGGQGTGLTVSGGATTTGNLNVRGGLLRVGSDTQAQVFGYSEGVSSFDLYADAAASYLYLNDAGGRDINLSTVGNSYFNTSGNLGVGSTTPGSLLSIGNTNGINFSTATSTFSSTGGINITSGCYAVGGVCLSAGGASLTGTQGQLAYFSGTNTAVGTSSLFIATNSYVGIGTSTPTAELSVWGDMEIGKGSTANIRSYNSSRSAYGFLELYNGSTGSVSLGTTFSTGDIVLSPGTSGNVGIGTTSPWANLSVHSTAGTPQFVIGSSTATQFIVDKFGNLGIGTTTPTTLLDVHGDTGTAYKAAVRATASTAGTGFSMFNTSFTNPFTSGTAQGFNSGDPVSSRFTGGMFPWTAAGGGLALIGNSDGSGVPGISILSNQGTVSAATRAAIYLNAVTNSAGAATTLGSEDNLFQIANNATALLTLDGSGTLGIGTTTPWAKLSINSTAGIPQFIIGSSTTQFIVDKNGNVGIGTSSPEYKLDLYAASALINNAHVASNASFAINRYSSPSYSWTAGLRNDLSPGLFSFSNAAGTRVLNLTSDGNVGIGTTSPLAKLHVAVNSTGVVPDASADELFIERLSNAGMTIGSTNTATGNIFFGDAESSTIGRIIYDHATNDLSLWTNNTERLTINSSGSVNIGSLTASRLVATDASKNLVSTLTLANLVASLSDVSGSTGTTNLVLSASPTLTGTLAAASATFSGTITEGGSAVISAANIDTCAEFIALVVSTGTCGSAVFSVSPTLTGTLTAAIIDVSGDVIVGPSTDTVPPSANTIGARVDNAGYIAANRSAGPSAYFGRTNDGNIVEFYDAGTLAGSISINAINGNILYNAFTGAHYSTTEESIEYGMLVELDGTQTFRRDSHDSEPTYGVRKTAHANSRAVFGSMSMLMEPSEPHDPIENPYLVMAVGNGDMWVVQGEEDSIQPGDYLISSNLAGHAIKDPGTYMVSHIVAKAVQKVDWSSIQEVGGMKRAKISVTFEQFDRNATLSDVLAAMATSSASSTEETEVQQFADVFMTNIFARMTSWLADAGNGIAEIFAKTIRAENVYADTVTANKLCLEDLCVTKAQLQQILNNSGSALTPSPTPTPEPATEEPSDEPDTEEPASEPEVVDAEEEAPEESTETTQPEPEASPTDASSAPESPSEAPDTEV